MRILKYLLAVLFLVSFYGCFGVKKTRTITITETVIKIDTVIKFVPDTVTKLIEVRLTDTAYIDTPVSAARSYYSTSKQRIVLELQNKTIKVPVTIYKAIRTETAAKTKEVTPNKRGNWFIWLLVGGIVVLIIRDRKTLFASSTTLTNQR